MPRGMGRFVSVSCVAWFLGACGDTGSNADMPSKPDLAVSRDMTGVANDMTGVADLTGSSDLTSNNDLAKTTADMATPPDLYVPPMLVTIAVGANNTNTFNPNKLTIRVGDSVKWKWATGSHSVVSGLNGQADNQFCSPNNMNCSAAPLSQPGAAYTFTFMQPGAYPYFCGAHFAAGMVGQVIVQ